MGFDSSVHCVKRTGKEHSCLKCYCPVSGTRHSKIQRARDKRAWRKFEKVA